MTDRLLPLILVQEYWSFTTYEVKVENYVGIKIKLKHKLKF